jgi:thioredoxin-dependent peroxiredoxin
MSMYGTPGMANTEGPAPAFRARDVAGREIDTADFQGRSNLVLFFYRNSLCQTCREELADLADKYPQIAEQGSEVIAISTDGIDMAKDLAVDLQLPYPVISDPDGDIIRLYGVYDEDTATACPTLFLLDKNGVSRHKRKINGLNDLVPAGEIVDRLKDLGTLHGRAPFKSSRFQ